MNGEVCRWMWKQPSSEQIYDLYSIPLRNEDGTISKMEVFHDITKRKLAEEELVAIKENLEIIIGDKTKELKDRISELERFHNATIDREIRMRELKDEIKKLKEKL